MKQIIKHPEPKEFIAWKAMATENWTPKYANLQKPEKEIVRQSLLSEQGNICCYCQRRITSQSSHIEHFRPQANDTEDFSLEIEYSNLHASCFPDAESEFPLHCGPLKGAHFDENLLISPLEPNCETEFDFGFDGTIAPKKHSKRAEYTISLLGLDIKKLTAKRRLVIEVFISDLENETEQDFQIFLTKYLDKNDGSFQEYHTALKKLFG